jgi:cyclophilin family peptidyl-prolyl cis-trans isomerase
MNERLIGVLFIAVFFLAIGAFIFSRLKQDNSSIAIEKNTMTKPILGEDQQDQDIPTNVPARQLPDQPGQQAGQNNQQFPIQQNRQIAGAQTQQKQAQQQQQVTLQFPGILSPDQISNKKIVMQIANKGTIEFELFDQDAPKTVSNFVYLTKLGFYNGLTFHRVEPGFVIQGGDPKGNGTGGPGYRFEDEPVKRKYEKGIVAMANAGPNTNGSQFFIMLDDHPELPSNYTIFGKVTVGQDVVDKVQVGDVMQSVSVADNDAPAAP